MRKMGARSLADLVKMAETLPEAQLRTPTGASAASRTGSGQ
jgi:hypothetical protein